MSNVRYDLIPVQGITEVSKVLTKKLETHEVNEWKYGISWTEVLSSLKKHLTEFELGNDFTVESSVLLSIIYDSYSSITLV